MEKQGGDDLFREMRALSEGLESVIERVEGDEILSTVAELRSAAKASRAGDENAAAELQRIVATLDTHEALEMAMAFTVYFELVNLAEENHRVQILRKRSAAVRKGLAPPQRETIEAAIAALKSAGVSAAELQQYLDGLSIELVLTAHPTEAKRRTLLTKLKRLGEMLRESDATDEDVLREITSLWLTDRSRSERPEVGDEVKTGMWYFDTTLWATVPRLHRDLEHSLEKYFPGVNVPKRWLTFGSWIGGDRDGNPFVTADVTRETLLLHRRLALAKCGTAARRLSRLLSVSTRRDRISADLKKLIGENENVSEHVRELGRRYPHEPYRFLLAALQSRLEQSAESASDICTTNGSAKSEFSAADVSRMLETATESLLSNRGKALADGELNDLRIQVEAFGLHTASLDIRQHSSKYEAAVAELLRIGDIANAYESLSESERVKVLDSAAGRIAWSEDLAAKLSTETRYIIDPLRVAALAVAELGEHSIGACIISMANNLSDVLELLMLMEVAGLKRDIAPLFETLEDLEQAPGVLELMFAHPRYRDWLGARGGRQVVMLGYSDSNKDCGYITANWALFEAQEEIAKVCKTYDICLCLFHGRGGSIARGGGPAAKAILAQPCGLADGQIRVTEQGEVLSTRYHDEDLAHRILEQMTYGVLLGMHAARSASATPVEWREAMEKMSKAGFAAYKALVHDDPGFLDFWKQATPIEEITLLRLGSRPSFRKATQSVSDLRAIPWVFSWMQSRFVFPGWYGLGSALASGAETRDGMALLRRMYEKWTFFQTLVDNAQLTLLKADMRIAKLYAGLVEDASLRDRIFGLIEQEYFRSVRFILELTEQSVLLERELVLMRSVQLRNPYVDPLNYIQVEMIRRMRAHRDYKMGDEDAVRSVVELTINGVSSGLKNTG
jgi:phosphoenolpyruvate carboxylase